MIREIIDVCCYYDAFFLFPRFLVTRRTDRTDSPPQTTKYRHSSNVIRGEKRKGSECVGRKRARDVLCVCCERNEELTPGEKKGNSLRGTNIVSLPRADKGKKGGGVMRGGGPFPRINWTFPPCGFQMDEARDFPPRAPLPPLFLFWAD